MRWHYLLPCLCGLAVCLALTAQEKGDFKVGIQPDGRIVVPTNQVLKPAGKQVTFPGRPVDLALAEDGKTLVVKNMLDLVFIDIESAKIKQTLDLHPKEGPEPIMSIKNLITKPISPTGKAGHPSPPGFSVVGILVQGGRIYASDSQHLLRIGIGQMLDGREMLKKAAEIRNDRRHLCLLQHHL